MLTIERVHSQIRQEILSGAIPCGDYVIEKQLAAQFGVSRTPVREALKRIESTGLIYKESNGRFRVASLSEPLVEEHFVMRLTLKETVLGRVFRDPACRDEIMVWHDFFASVSANGIREDNLGEAHRMLTRMRTFIYDNSEFKSIAAIIHDFNLLVNNIVFHEEHVAFVQKVTGLYWQMCRHALKGRFDEALLFHRLAVLGSKQAVMDFLKKNNLV